MQECYTVCGGLDVHKKTVAACLRAPGPEGRRSVQVRTFATTTRALVELAEWLVAAGWRHVAMESTGIYWRPVYQILEERQLTVLLVKNRDKAAMRALRAVAALLARGANVERTELSTFCSSWVVT